MILGLSVGGRLVAAIAVALSPPTHATSAPDGVLACDVTLVATGRYRAEIRTGGPVPLVEFMSAEGPVFDRIMSRGGLPSCDQPIGRIDAPVKSPNASVLLFQIANELYAAAANEWRTSQRQHLVYAYRDFGNLALEIRGDIAWAGFREIIADVIAQLVRKYANPTDLLTDAGAKWVADQALKMFLQEYVAGRDPALIIDGLLADMVHYLQGRTQLLVKTLGGPAMEQALKPHLTRIATDVKALLIDPHPDVQNVRVEAFDEGTDCRHALDLAWHFKGGAYRAVLTIRCGPQQPDHVASVVINAPTVAPGDAAVVSVTALNRLGVAFPLSGATINGLGAVMPDGSAEPAATITGTTATFAFTAARPRGDGSYPVSVRVVTDRSTGLLTGLNTAPVTVLNVPPVIESVSPASASAEPGAMLELGQVRVLVSDDNADMRHAREVAAATLAVAHPGGLITTPRFDNADGAREVSFDATSGRYVFEFSRAGKVQEPHPHGSWPATITIADDNGLTASSSVSLEVKDVAPQVVTSRVTPQFVHRSDGRTVDAAVRVRDGNGATDIVSTSIDALAAGGGQYTNADGLVDAARGEDWIDFRLATAFAHTDVTGQHPVMITVRDEASEGTHADFLSVGNTAPQTFGHGYITGLDPRDESAAGSAFLPAKGVCPNQPFRAGVIAGDPEGDPLAIVGTIVETGARGTFRNTGGRIWMVDMQAPGTPGAYTIRIDIDEVPAEKRASVTMPLEVVPCEGRDEERRLAIGQPVTPVDIANAPRDPAAQALLGTFAGVTVVGAPPAAQDGPSGPSVRALRDSLAELLGGPGGSAEVETYLVATGGSTGPVVQFYGINRSGEAVRMPVGPFVLEPVRIDRATQQRINGLIGQILAAGGAPDVLDAYCLELFLKPPAAGTLLRVAAVPMQQQFADFTRLFDISDRLQSLGRFRPDSDPGDYLHAIRQWSIWSHRERLDVRGFEHEFLRVTRENMAQAGEAWTADVEAAVRHLVPNRWNDIRQVLSELERGGG